MTERRTEPNRAGQIDEREVSRRTTITDVARIANVSIATVSKVVNGRRGVGESTRERVQLAVERSGYVSTVERKLSLRSVGEETIELLIGPEDVANPYLATFMGGATEFAGTLRAGLLVRSIESIAGIAPTEWAQGLARAGRVGVIELTSRYSSARENALRAVGLPMILVDPIDRPRPSTPSIGATNWAGAFEATKHLLDLGHRHIAYIGGPPRASCDIVRAHGWAAAMAEAGQRVNVEQVPRHSYTFEHGLKAGAALLDGRIRPTAIFAGSDISALGVLEAARRAGLAVPRDLSVVGFDDTYLARTSSPRLTTVHQPIADIARTAVSSVVRLAHGDPLPAKRVELATHLVVGESTAPPDE